MTSTARTSSKPSGFTLIEIVMVLAISTMLLGGAVAYMVFSGDERELRDVSGQVELLAKRARTTAILQQTPYALEFRPGIIRLLPLAEAGRDEKETALGQSIGGEKVEFSGPNGPVHDEIALDPSMFSFVRRWNAQDWLPMSDRIVHVWRFDPDGLCEPLGVRLTIGRNYIEDTYHPLTASIRETALEVR
jgi:prepilin-type N-terminal cleavage/methylation domain-containing protein